MYKLKLIYDPEPRTQTLKESITFCATVDLYTRYGIDSYQCSASELLFESDRDRLLGFFYLGGSASFYPVIL